jgi:hypothetical protein
VVADSAPAVPVSAASAIESALGDSVMVGAGSDALVKVRGKLPRTVAGEAISLLEVTIAKPSIAVGDTVHAKVEAFDDAGQRVTTPQMVWTSSNPRVARFLAPGDLIAGQEGSATITVTAGPTSVTKEFVVGPKVPRRGAAGPKGTRRAEKS